MISNEDLWSKLGEFKVYRRRWDEENQTALPENLNLFKEVLYNHTGEFYTFIMSLEMSLKLYPTVLGIENKKGFINYDHLFYCDIILISLITSLESYLVRSFRKLAFEVKIEDLDMETFVNFIKEFRIEPEYFKALKEHSNHEFILSNVLPNRMDFQQKNKAKIAYKLFNIYLPTLTDEKQVTWNRIFGEKDGCIALRHGAIHAGIINSVIKKIDGDNVVDENLIFEATLDISKFVYELDKSISRKFPKSKYPNFYAQKAQD